MKSDRDLWQRTRAAFDGLVDLQPVEREARLQQLGLTDPMLRERVERLLRVDSDAEAELSRYSFGSDDPAVDITNRDPLRIVGRTVAQYRINNFLASGGMGVVYSADDLKLGRAVALKFPQPHQEVERTAKERFINEARSVATIDHPAVCSVYEIGESEFGIYLAMPLYPGETLKDRLARDSALEPDAALGIVQQVAAGLAAAHAAGVIHRDLKPGNVMLLPDGTVRVLDFGLAKIRDVDLTRSKLVLGTISYVAPEQLRGESPDARVDMWAIGVMLHEMLTGTPPFFREHELSVMNAILHEEPQPPSTINRDLPPGVDQVVAGLLQKDPADRYQSAEALITDIEAIRSGAPIVVRSPFWGRTRLRRAVRRRALPILAVAASVAVVAALMMRNNSVDRASGAAALTLEWNDDTAEISTAAELTAALVPANAGRRVRLRPGVYELVEPITLPDGMVLEGAGVMEFDSAGRPLDFADETRTSLRMTADVGGDLLTFGHGAVLRNIEIVDLPGRSGSVVAVVSRSSDDSVSATIIESVIVNPNPLAIGPGGPLGRGLLVITLNPNMGAEPAAHEGTVLAVRMVRSVIRSPSGGGGLFAYNFAARSRIAIDIAESVIGGSSEANGGVSRPDAVHDAEVRIDSRGNLYRNDWADPCLSPLLGWNLTGGSGAPIPIPLPATTRNRLSVHSVDDRIDGFTTAIIATGSRRFFAEPLNAAPSDNTIDLTLSGTVITAPPCGAAGAGGRTMGIATVQPRSTSDFLLTGAWVENDELEAGDRNVVRADFRNVTGSGSGDNRYIHVGGVSGPLPRELSGSGNRLEFVGDPDNFRRLNRGIEPAPPARFFTGQGREEPPGPRR